MVSRGAPPVNFGFAYACVLQDAPDGFFFFLFKVKSPICLMVCVGYMADFLGLFVTKPKPQENSLCS